MNHIYYLGTVSYLVAVKGLNTGNGEPT